MSLLIRYVGSAIGDYFTESPPFDLNGAYNDSINVTPLIFILSPGADPTDYLLQVTIPLLYSHHPISSYQ